MRIYVGNLPFNTGDDELRDLFAAHGEVGSAKVATERDSGRSRGFGFVDMTDGGEAQRAIDALNGASVGGRALVVNEARPLEPRGDRPSGGFSRDRRDNSRFDRGGYRDDRGGGGGDRWGDRGGGGYRDDRGGGGGDRWGDRGGDRGDRGDRGGWDDRGGRGGYRR